MSSRIKTIELFLALGFATASSAPALASNPDELTEAWEINSSDTLILAEGGEGGEGAEGGEGGEGGISTGDVDTDYMANLGLMRGRLITAQELIDLGDYEQADPLIGKALEESYGAIETVLPEKGVEDFKPTLVQLQDLIKSAPESPEVTTLLEQSTAAIDDAIAALPESQLNSPEFVLEAMVAMLQSAAAEYDAATINGQSLEVLAYQDSRGFFLYSDQLYQTIAESKAAADPQGHETIVASLAELQTAWPSIEPPSTPIKDPSEIYGLVSQIEFSK